MKWQTKNHKGETVTWYSEDEYIGIKEHYEQQLKAMIDKYNELLRKDKEQ